MLNYFGETLYTLHAQMFYITFYNTKCHTRFHVDCTDENRRKKGIIQLLYSCYTTEIAGKREHPKTHKSARLLVFRPQTT